MKLLLALVLLLAGCTSVSDPPSQLQPEAAPAQVSFTDDLGREVVLEKAPERVASLIGSFSDMWNLAGGEKSLVASAHDGFTHFDLQDDLSDVGAIKNPDLEKLADANPDLVLASAKNAEQKELEKTLTDMNMPVAYFDVDDFDDYARVMELFVSLTGEEKALEQVEAQKTRIEEVRQKAKGQYAPVVLYLRATGKGVTAMGSDGSVLGEMLQDLNADNITDSYGKLKSHLSMETIYAADPEVIFLVAQGDGNFEEYVTNPLWGQLAAVKNGRSYVLDGDLFNLKPNARWADAYEELYSLLYEE